MSTTTTVEVGLGGKAKVEDVAFATGPHLLRCLASGEGCEIAIDRVKLRVRLEVAWYGQRSE